MSASDDPLREVTLASDTVWEGVFLRVLRDRVRLPDGHETTREYLRHPGAAAMIALTDAGEVVLERQFRYPLGCSIIELPAGKLDAGEPPLVCARRELEEETGYTAECWETIGHFHPCVGYSDEVIHVFLARGLRAGRRCLDHGEFLEVLHWPLPRLWQAIFAGEITDGKTLSALLLALPRLRALGLPTP